MHGLIFETSVWLLAESTRLLPYLFIKKPLNKTPNWHIPNAYCSWHSLFVAGQFTNMHLFHFVTVKRHIPLTVVWLYHPLSFIMMLFSWNILISDTDYARTKLRAKTSMVILCRAKTIRHTSQWLLFLEYSKHSNFIHATKALLFDQADICQLHIVVEEKNNEYIQTLSAVIVTLLGNDCF